MRLNDKALTFITGLVLLLGVGTFVHKGDELFGPKTSTTQIAKADITLDLKTDALPVHIEHSPVKMPDKIKAAALAPETAPISDFVLVRGNRAASVTSAPKTYNTVKIDPVPVDCTLTLSTKSLRGARVLLDVVAPCHKNKAVSITHAGLRFSEIIDDKGMITIIIPVLSDPATIEVSFADGTTKSISAPVKGLSSLQRTAIAWSGPANLQLRADESAFKASDNTLITAQNARSYKQSYLQGGGYLTTLGNKAVEGGKFIQIYSIEDPNDIFVDFQVVLQDISHLCGARITIDTVRYSAALGTELTSKNVSIRNCSAKNKNIVLKNMLRSLIVAERN